MVINARHAPCTFGQQNSHMCNIKLVQFLCFSCRFFPPQERHRICNSFFLDLPSSSSHVGAFYCQNVDKKGAWCVFKSEKRCLVDKSFPQSIGVIYIYIYHIFPIYHILHEQSLGIQHQGRNGKGCHSWKCIRHDLVLCILVAVVSVV